MKFMNPGISVRKDFAVALVVLSLIPLSLPVRGIQDEPRIDPIYGRELMQKYQRGEKLTTEELAYFDRVKAEISKRAADKSQTPV